MGTSMQIISDASDYVKSGILDNLKNWLILVILLIIQLFTISIIPLFNGYISQIYKTVNNEVPEIKDFKQLFIDGWKLNIVTILYMIPAMIIAALFGLPGILAVYAGVENIIKTGHIKGVFDLVAGSLGIIVGMIVFIIFTLIMSIAYVHYNRRETLSEAFNVQQIVKKISSGIGWGNYLALWIITCIFELVLCVIIWGMDFIPPLGVIVGIVLTPLWAVFIAKINCNIYDNKQ